ncbi:RNA-directed DNA polymerase from mobile element jockey [Eumeta japonica]|uniref:RNA-directed DNA polymerase from mobile element jockey n=1 Tax=Eumeta variegata TaxID=151549 RepID=A0A4C1Y1E1_EUMVA|nr:RNA-directed DNA polymerase from mobile element jockey [Eumeta japonica]
MVMAVFHAVSSSEISKFAGQLRACRNVEEKLQVLVRYHHLMTHYDGSSYYRRTVYLPSPKPLLRSDLRALLALEDAVILFGDFNCKNPRWGCAVMDQNGKKLNRLQNRLEFKIIAPSTATYFPYNDSNRPSTLDIALTKGVVLKLNSIETLHSFFSDHRPVLLKMGPPDDGRPISTIKTTDWKRVSTAFEKIDTPPLNSIPDDIRMTEEIDHAICALTSHVRTVVEKCERKVPASSDHRKFSPDILELIRAKNAALRSANAYPTPEYRSRARALQREVKARVQEFRNESWSDLMEEIRPSHQAFWKITKSSLKTEGYTPIPLLKRMVQLPLTTRSALQTLSRLNALTIDIFYFLLVARGKQKKKTSLEPKDDLTPVSLSEVQTLVKSISTRKAPGLDGGKSSALRPLSPPVPAYTNDIPRPTSGVQLVLFADDTALFFRSRTRRSIFRHLPRAIDELGQWFRKWRIEDASKRFFDIVGSHPNALLHAAVDCKPPPPSHFIRRPRNVLIDPPDALTAAVDSLIDVNDTHD